MAQYTQAATLTTTWATIASGKETVLIQRKSIVPMEVFIGDTQPASNIEGHELAAGSLKTASFDGLPPATKVWARVKSSNPADTASIIVTAF